MVSGGTHFDDASFLVGERVDDDKVINVFFKWKHIFLLHQLIHRDIFYQKKY